MLGLCVWLSKILVEDVVLKLHFYRYFQSSCNIVKKGRKARTENSFLWEGESDIWSPRFPLGLHLDQILLNHERRGHFGPSLAVSWPHISTFSGLPGPFNKLNLHLSPFLFCIFFRTKWRYLGIPYCIRNQVGIPTDNFCFSWDSLLLRRMPAKKSNK